MATEITEPTVLRWDVTDYYRIGELGLFEGKHVELIAGEILEMCPQGPTHASCVALVSSVLSAIFGPGYWLRLQMPLRLSDDTEPEPDIAVVPGGPRDYMTAHPTTADLVVEVSLSSLNFDRRQKSSLYASFGLPEYWILDVENRQLTVSRRPVADESEPFGYRYDDVKALSDRDSVSPLSLPNASASVASMLP